MLFFASCSSIRCCYTNAAVSVAFIRFCETIVLLGNRKNRFVLLLSSTNPFGKKTFVARVGVWTIKVTVLSLSVVSLRSKLGRTKVVHVSSVDGEADLFWRIGNLKIQSVEPDLVGGHVSVPLSAGEQRQRFQYPTAVNRAGKKVKDVSLRHDHLPTLSTRVNDMKYVDARKTVLAGDGEKIWKIFTSVW